METKKCTKCKEVKDLEAFSRDKRRPDGLQCHCKACNKKYADQRYLEDKETILRRNAVWYAENKERAADSAARWESNNKERRAELHARWVSDNPDKVRAAQQRDRENNPEAIAASKRRYRATHADKEREYGQQYRTANADRAAEWNREWYRRNPDKARAMSATRRAVLAAATVEDFTPSDMYADWEDHELWGCFFCAGPVPPKDLAMEHFYPLNPRKPDEVQQGPHAVWNLVPAHKSCNSSKSDREPWAFLSSALAERGIDLDACLALFDDNGNLIRK